MEQFEITLTAISEKKVTILAESTEEAMKKAGKIYEETDLLDFTDDDVMELSVGVVVVEEEANLCATCDCYCHTCEDDSFFGR